MVSLLSVPFDKKRLRLDTGKRIIIVVSLLMEMVMVVCGLYPAIWIIVKFVSHDSTIIELAAEVGYFSFRGKFRCF